MKGNKGFKGYLERLRENVEVLDSAIDDAKAMGKKGAEGRARLKAIRDLVELRNSTLNQFKTHLLGRDETGAPNEPADYWEDNPELMFERQFDAVMRRNGLELKCVDCGKESEEVETRLFSRPGGCDRVDLCESFFEKRNENETGSEVRT